MQISGDDVMRAAGAALGLVVAGCGSESPMPDETRLGTLVMPLATVVNDVHYQLSGSFYLTGPVSERMQPNGSGTIVYVLVPPGAYEVELADGWSLRRQFESGTEEVEAELISPNPLAVDIEPRSSTHIFWVFGTQGTRVGFDRGFIQGNLEVADSSNPQAEVTGDLLLTQQSHVNALFGAQSISGDLQIEGPMLTINELVSLTRVGGSLIISETSALTSLDGLEGLSEVGGQLRISGNAVLSNLRGLAALTTAESVAIVDNPALPTCEAQRLVGDLTVAGSVEVYGNDDSGTCP